MTTYRSLNHTKWHCQYHVVFIPKYRRKAMYGGLRRDLGEVFRRLALHRESEVEEGHLLPDHVHMMMSIPPGSTLSPRSSDISRGRVPSTSLGSSRDVRGTSWGSTSGPGATGWRRLRLLRQIGDELVPSVEQFLLMDDVVAVEDGAALVPGQEHGDPLGDVRADQVTGGGAPAIVEEAGRHPGRLAGGAPRRAPTADGDAVAVEDERAVGVAACPPPRQGLGDGV